VRLDPNKDLYNELKDLRERLAIIPNDTSRISILTYAAATVTTAFDRLGLFLPVVVGGLAVETYTAGGYTTQDIDFVHPDPASPPRIMDALGFIHQNGSRYYEHSTLNVWVEFPGGSLDGARNRVQEMLLNDDTRYLVIGIEDIIIDRVAAYQDWDNRDQNSPDGIQALTMLIAQRDTIDYDYMRRTAEEKGYAEALAELQALADAHECAR
jgi:hypothetical protein